MTPQNHPLDLLKTQKNIFAEDHPEHSDFRRVMSNLIEYDKLDLGNLAEFVRPDESPPLALPPAPEPLPPPCDNVVEQPGSRWSRLKRLMSRQSVASP